MHNHHRRAGRRRSPRGRVHGFVQPLVLFQLAQMPAYGYELMERLGEEEGSSIDPALLYRTLHRFEERGLVTSTWESASSGPDRRVYDITAAGLESLHAWAVELGRTREQLDRFLRDYQGYFPEERR